MPETKYLFVGGYLVVLFSLFVAASYQMMYPSARYPNLSIYLVIAFILILANLPNIVITAFFR